MSSPSHSHKTNNPLESFSVLVKRTGSFWKVFDSPKQNGSSTSAHKRSDDANGVQPCALDPVTLSARPAAASGDVCYEAESPDEAALVYAAKTYGFTLLARTPNSVTVRVPSGEELVFEVLDTLAFDSNRKRMSVLVRHPITGEYVLYTKGADYAIMELLGTPYAGE